MELKYIIIKFQTKTLQTAEWREQSKDSVNSKTEQQKLFSLNHKVKIDFKKMYRVPEIMKRIILVTEGQEKEWNWKSI